MKLTVDKYEIDIKVRYDYETRANKNATMNFLNFVSILANDAAEFEHRVGAHSIGIEAQRFASQIYTHLEANGLYKNI